MTRAHSGAARLSFALSLGALSLGASLSLGAPAASPTPLPRIIGPSPAGDTAIDGFFNEWEARPTFALDVRVSGRSGGPTDLGGTVQLAYDADHLYVAAQVVDDVFQPGARTTGDRLELIFVPAGAKARRLRIVLNQLELGLPPALELDGRAYAQGAVSGTTRRDGWAVEARVRLRDLPGVAGTDLAFAAIVQDADADPVNIEATLSTAALNAAGLPGTATVRLDATAEALATYLADRDHPALLGRYHGNVTGDALDELVLVTALDIVVAGRLPDGATYLYFTHGWRTGAQLVSAELTDLDGRAGKELRVTHTEWAVPDEVQVEVVEIFGAHDGILRRMFAAKTAERFTKLRGDAVAALSVQGRGRGARTLKIGAAKVTGLNPGNYVDVDAHMGLPNEPLPLPWGDDKRGVVYTLQGEAWQRR